MRDPRLFAEALAILALPLTLIHVLENAGFNLGMDIPRYAAGEYALVAASAAFLVSWKIGGPLLSMPSPAVGLTDTISQVAFAAVYDSPAPLIGAFFGMVIFTLGMAKNGLTSVKTTTATMMTKRRTFMPSTGRAALSRAVIAATVVVVVAVGAVGLYFATSSSATTSTTSSYTGPPPIQVSIYSGAASSSDPPGYTPDSITLVMGVNNTVTWTNNDSVHHTVTSTSAPSGGSFNSGNINPSSTYTHTFTVAGTYNYDCSYHTWMMGTIIVKASS